jgi:uncharacterized protein
MVRRVVALGLVGLVAFGSWRVVSGVIGGDDPVADADAPGSVDGDNDAPGATGGDVGAEAGDTAPSGSVAAVVDPVVTDPPADTGPPTAANPAKVLIVGDSDAGTFGPYLETLLDGTNVAETELNYKVSSGLARPDFFDWPAELRSTLPGADADIIVATFGGNDSQGLAVADGSFIVSDPVTDKAEWTVEYQQRAGEVMDLMLDTGATVIWVGIPNDDSADVTARLRVQDEAVRAAAAERPEVIFIDTWKRFSGRDGGWAEFVIDPRDGVGKDVRAEDGFHLNTDGAEILALDIAQAIRDDLRTRGAAI